MRRPRAKLFDLLHGSRNLIPRYLRYDPGDGTGTSDIGPFAAISGTQVYEYAGGNAIIKRAARPLPSSARRLSRRDLQFSRFV
jgi:hypothetical protein